MVSHSNWSSVMGDDSYENEKKSILLSRATATDKFELQLTKTEDKARN